MKCVLIDTISFGVSPLNNVTSITYDSENHSYTVINGGTTYHYDSTRYKLNILW